MAGRVIGRLAAKHVEAKAPVLLQQKAALGVWEALQVLAQLLRAVVC